MEVPETAGSRKPWQRSPVFIVEQLFFKGPLQDDHKSPTAVKDWGYPAQMFRDGKSHSFHLVTLYQFSCRIASFRYQVDLAGYYI
jgi:hypothetical protein